MIFSSCLRKSLNELCIVVFIDRLHPTKFSVTGISDNRHC